MRYDHTQLDGSREAAIARLEEWDQEHEERPLRRMSYSLNEDIQDWFRTPISDVGKDAYLEYADDLLNRSAAFCEEILKHLLR